MEAQFKVKTTSFEGPLDVLLNLIEKRKLFVNDISLSKVADDYMSYIKTFESFPMAESADFILIASTLVLIKSKSLLPSLELTPDEQGNIADLERRLKIYKKIKDACLLVKERFGKKILYSPRIVKIEPIFSPDKSMNKSAFILVINEVLRNLPKKELLQKVLIEKVMSLEEMITNLTKRVTISLRMSFKEFSQKDVGSKVQVIVSFLAMLELVKQGVIKVKQNRHFEDIEMETERIGVPNYS